MNFYLMKENPLFQGYICLSPELSPEMDTRLEGQLGKIQQQTAYFLATGTEDKRSLRQNTESLHYQLKEISNPNLRYYYEKFRGSTHYSLVAKAIPSALESIFSKYRPISKKEYKETLLTIPESPYDYLVAKYADIKDLFSIEDPIRVNDFTAVFRALQKRQDWRGLEKLGKLADLHHPKTMLGTYYTAQAWEQIGKPKKAMHMYRSGFLLEEVSFLTKDLMIEKADKIKSDFGY